MFPPKPPKAPGEQMRGRGRPRKILTEEEQQRLLEKKSRGRGRPRKDKSAVAPKMVNTGIVEEIKVDLAISSPRSPDHPNTTPVDDQLEEVSGRHAPKHFSQDKKQARLPLESEVRVELVGFLGVGFFLFFLKNCFHSSTLMLVLPSRPRKKLRSLLKRKFSSR